MSRVTSVGGHLPSLGRRGEGWVVLQACLFALILVTGLTGRRRLRRSRLLTVPLTAAGLFLTGIGGTLAVRGTLDLRESLAVVPRPKAGGRLIDSGVYALVRHPIYGGMVLGALGWALVRRTARSAAMAAAALVFFELKAGREEAWLETTYEGYAGYRRRTRKLIPFVR